RPRRLDRRAICVVARTTSEASSTRSSCAHCRRAGRTLRRWQPDMSSTDGHMSVEVVEPGPNARRITVTVNGARRVVEVEPRLLLAHLLRQGLGLSGTHIGCDTTNCGACTVLVDGRPAKSCTMFAVQAHGHEVRTV